jgi:hypothetical protein
MGICGSKKDASGKTSSGGGLSSMATDMLPKFDPTQVFAAKIVYSQTEGSMFTKAKAAIMAAYPKAKVTGETS